MINTHRTRWSLAGAFGAGIAASVCCLAPLLAIMLGAGGAGATGILTLESYRPMFIGVTLALLARAIYRGMRTPCVDGCSRRTGRVALWVVSPLVLAVLIVPYVMPVLSFARTNGQAPTTASTGQDACCPLPAENGSKQHD